MFVALGIAQERSAHQIEEAQHLHQRKTAAGFLVGKLRIVALVLRGVGGGQGAAVQDLGVVAKPIGLLGRQAPLGLDGGSLAGALEHLQGQAFAGGAIGAVVGVGLFGASVMQSQMAEDLAHGLTAGATGIEGLVEESPKSSGEAVETLSAVGAFVALGEQAWGQQRGEDLFQVQQRLAGKAFQVPTEIGQARAPSWEVGSLRHGWVKGWRKSALP